MEWILGLFLGIGLAASAGFRVFVPLFAMSLAAYFEIIPLNESWKWVGSFTAVVVLGIATLIEALAYFFPYVDNLLDTIALPLATVAGTLVVVATVNDMSPVVTWALAIIAGGGTAGAIKGMTTSTRAVSTVSTAGVANPIMAGVETIFAGFMAIVSILLPILAIVFVFVILFFFRKLFRFFRKKQRSEPV
ncbi:MAG: DUF4126 domain-containing protein [Flavobacteriales bacterium]|jgi:hypothetical protein|nr:DUF4126 domain-containing protein [Flavobacteriales bacterium]